MGASKGKELMISIVYFITTVLVQLAIGIILGIVVAIKIGIENAQSGNIVDGVALAEQVQQRLVDLTTMSIFLYIIVCSIIFFIVYKIKKQSMRKEIGLNKIKSKHIVLTIMAAVGLSVFINQLLNIIDSIVNLNEVFPNYEEIIQSIMGGSIIMTFISVVILAPIFEEVLFRGIILRRLSRAYSITATVVIQAVLFGILHFNMLQFLYATVLGLFLGFIVIWTDSLYAGIIIHMIFNGSSFIIDNILRALNVNIMSTIIVLIIGMMITGFAIFSIHRSKVIVN